MAKNKIIRILLAFCILLFIYNVLKCFFVPFYWDEIYTYFHYVKDGVIFPTTFDGMDANNHFLNTWLIEIFVFFFGASEFVIRLPNLLFFILFLYCVTLISLTFSKLFFSICSFVILTLNPFMNDYFCLARGYGISMALLSANIYFFLLFLKDKNNYRHAALSSLCIALALLANFSLLNYSLMFFILIGATCIFNHHQHKQYSAGKALKELAIFLSPALVLVFVLPVLFNLRRANALVAGRNNGFWQDTIISLINRFLYLNPDTLLFNIVIQACILCVLILALFILFFHFRKIVNHPQLQFLAFLVMSLFICFAANYLQHQFMEIPFGYGRTSIYYYILFGMLTVYTFSYLENYFPKIAISITGFIAFFFIFNFTLNASLFHAIEWREEGDTKKVVKYLEEQKKTIHPTKKNITIGMVWSFYDDIKFYREIYNLRWLNGTKTAYAFYPLNDYFFIPEKDTGLLPDIKYKIVLKLNTSKSVLIVNQQKWIDNEIYTSKINFDDSDNAIKYKSITNLLAYSGHFSGLTDGRNPYSDGFSFVFSDSLTCADPGIVLFKGMFYTNSADKNCMLVISYERNGKSYWWQSWELNDFGKKTTVWQEFDLVSYLPLNLRIGDEIKAYIWNNSKTPYYFDDLSFKIINFHKDTRLR